MPGSAPATLSPLAAGVLAGRQVPIARAISLAERGGPDAIALLEELAAARRQGAAAAPRVGVTGPPGTGKSTLVSRLVAHVRQVGGEHARIAVVAVDPSSPFSGGAILGDRFRMADVQDDPGVFIRSMASRGAAGGLSEATEAACDVLEAAGYGELLVETVGVGQNEVAIASACETTVVVLNPESGDSVQALKAGLMEVADIVAVNKADHPRTERFVADLRGGLELQERQHGGWVTPVLATVATEDAGTAEAWAAVLRHREWLRTSGEGPRRARQRLRSRIRRLWSAIQRRRTEDDPALSAALDRAVAAVERGAMTPWRAAEGMA